MPLSRRIACLALLVAGLAAGSRMPDPANDPHFRNWDSAHLVHATLVERQVKEYNSFYVTLSKRWQKCKEILSHRLPGAVYKTPIYLLEVPETEVSSISYIPHEADLRAGETRGELRKYRGQFSFFDNFRRHLAKRRFRIEVGERSADTTGITAPQPYFERRPCDRPELYIDGDKREFEKWNDWHRFMLTGEPMRYDPNDLWTEEEVRVRELAARGVPVTLRVPTEKWSRPGATFKTKVTSGGKYEVSLIPGPSGGKLRGPPPTR